MKKKRMEQILNDRGLLSPNQFKKKVIIKGRLEKYPVVDDTMLAKEKHQLTLEEFTSTYFRSIVDEAAPGLAVKTASDLFRMNNNDIKRDLSAIEKKAKEIYSEIILDALVKKFPGIPMETIEKFSRSKNDIYRRKAKSYLKHYPDQYKGIQKHV